MNIIFERAALGKLICSKRDETNTGHRASMRRRFRASNQCEKIEQFSHSFLT